jgi:hypothetical protein
MTVFSHLAPDFESVFAIEAVNNPITDATKTPGYGTCMYHSSFVYLYPHESPSYSPKELRPVSPCYRAHTRNICAIIQLIGIGATVRFEQLHRCTDFDIFSNRILGRGASGTFRRHSNFTRDWSGVWFADHIRGITLPSVLWPIGDEVSSPQVLAGIH